MSIKEITKYKTDCGRTFDTIEQAEEYKQWLSIDQEKVDIKISLTASIEKRYLEDKELMRKIMLWNFTGYCGELMDNDAYEVDLYANGDIKYTIPGLNIDEVIK